MPRRRVVEDSDEEFDVSQASTSRGRTQTQRDSGVDVDEIRSFSNNLVKYILNNSVTKLPFKRQDIVKNILNGKAKIYDNVFKLACEKLEDVYGIRVAVVEDAKSVKQYISYCNFPACSTMVFNEEQTREATLLFLVLSYIFMKGSEIPEHALFDFLETIQIPSTDVHPYFGDVSKTVKDVFTKQQYLKRVKYEIEGASEERIVLKWGQRAHLEFDKKQMLKSVGKIMGKTPQTFVNQYSQAFGEEAMQCTEVAATQIIDDDVEM